MRNTNHPKNILIADAGASKTDWCLTGNGEILQRISRNGISPIYQTGEEIDEEIKRNVYPYLKGIIIDAVYFYGAGCIPEKIALVRDAIYQSFPIDTIQVNSDLVAAAHSLCGNEPGIVCIIGTGSNSCEWDGSAIVKQISPLGFILGDEGSGAVLGKQFVADALKNQLTHGLKEAFLTEYNLTPANIIDKIYRQPFPNRFLASLTPFLLKHINDHSVRRIVTNSFSAFFERNIMQYNYQKFSVNFVGSIAWYFSEMLKEVAAQNNIKIGKITQSPIHGLIAYYNRNDE